MDQNAITALCKALQIQTESSLLKLCKGDKQKALELFHDSFSRLWEKINNGEEIGNYAGFIYTTAFNKMLGDKKKHEREIPTDPNPNEREDDVGMSIDDVVMSKQSNPFDIATETEYNPRQKRLSEIVADEIKKLRATFQEILVLEIEYKEKYRIMEFKDEWERKRTKDEAIANVLNIIVGTMKVRRTEANMALRERLAQRGLGYFIMVNHGKKQERRFVINWEAKVLND